MSDDRPLCECGNLLKRQGAPRVDGTYGYYKSCSSCLRRKHKQGIPGRRGSKDRGHKGFVWRKLYGHLKGERCEECGFVPIHSCQLDIDHVDADRSNNDPSNLRTLCANCHRLKTMINGDYLP